MMSRFLGLVLLIASSASMIACANEMETGTGSLPLVRDDADDDDDDSTDTAKNHGKTTPSTGSTSAPKTTTPPKTSTPTPTPAPSSSTPSTTTPPASNDDNVKAAEAQLIACLATCQDKQCAQECAIEAGQTLVSGGDGANP